MLITNQPKYLIGDDNGFMIQARATEPKSNLRVTITSTCMSINLIIFNSLIQFEHPWSDRDQLLDSTSINHLSWSVCIMCNRLATQSTIDMQTHHRIQSRRSKVKIIITASFNETCRSPNYMNYMIHVDTQYTYIRSNLMRYIGLQIHNFNGARDTMITS